MVEKLKYQSYLFPLFLLIRCIISFEVKPTDIKVIIKLMKSIINSFHNIGVIISKYASKETTLGTKKNAIFLRKKSLTESIQSNFIIFVINKTNNNIIPINDPGIINVGIIDLIKNEITSPSI